MGGGARDDEDVATWTQTLGRDYKPCIIKEDLRASGEGGGGVDDDPLLDGARGRSAELRVGCCRWRRGYWSLAGSGRM